jgi:hypothetical protein
MFEPFHLQALRVLIAEPVGTNDPGHTPLPRPGLHLVEESTDNGWVALRIQLEKARRSLTVPAIVWSMNNAHHPAHDAAFTFGEPMGHLTSLGAQVPLDVVQFALIR